MRIKLYRYRVLPVITVTILIYILLPLTITPESYTSLENIYNNNKIINNATAKNFTDTAATVEVPRVPTATPHTSYNTCNGNTEIAITSNNNRAVYTNNNNNDTLFYRLPHYNNNHTTLMSYYPSSLYPADSRNGIYTYPYHEDNRGANNNILYNTLIKESSVEYVSSLKHVTCVASGIFTSLCKHRYKNKYNDNCLKGEDGVDEWYHYPNKAVDCYKRPYGRRRGVDDDETIYGNNNSTFSHIILRNIIYSMGEFYYIEASPRSKINSNNNNSNINTEKKENQYISFSYGGSYSSIHGDIPQQITDSITLRRIIINIQLQPSDDNNNIRHVSMQTALAELRRLLHRKRLNTPHELNNNKKKSLFTDNIIQSNNHNEKEGNNNKTQAEVSSSLQPLHLHVPLAYWQPPTDYTSQYHTIAETTAPALHALIAAVKYTSLTNELFSMDTSYNTKKHTTDRGEAPTPHDYYIFHKNNYDKRKADRGERLLLPPTLLITSRVRRAFPHTINMEVVDTSCSQLPNTAENPDLISSIDNNNKNCINTPLGRMMQAVVGTAGVYGLHNDHPQIYLGTNIGDKNIRNPWKRKHRYIKADLPDTETRGHDDILFIDRLLVGNPTHCEPIGGDAFYAEAVAQEQFLRGKGSTPRIDLSLRSNNKSFSFSSPQDEIMLEKRIKQFFEVYRECQLFVWEFRNFFLNKVSFSSVISSNRVSPSNPITDDINTRTSPKIIKKGSRFIPHLNTERGVSSNYAFSSLDNNSSYNSTAAIHRGTRILPIIPPVYSDSVTPINNNINISCKDGDGIHIVIASRKGEWAREFNEEEIADNIRAYFKKKSKDLLLKNKQEDKSWENNGNKSKEQKYFKELRIAQQAIYESATVRVVKFTGKKGLQHKLLHQLAVPKTTIFIGNHGANLIPSVFLRPNSGVITLSFSNPGFYPFVVFPRWLHWRDLVINQKCNMRLTKGKCKWLVHNSNDMWASKEQINKIVEFIEDIITEQIERPRKFSVE